MAWMYGGADGVGVVTGRRGVARRVGATWQVGGDGVLAWRVLCAALGQHGGLAVTGSWRGGESACGGMLHAVSGWHGGQRWRGVACRVGAVWWWVGGRGLACRVGAARCTTWRGGVLHRVRWHHKGRTRQVGMVERVEGAGGGGVTWRQGSCTMAVERGVGAAMAIEGVAPWCVGDGAGGGVAWRGDEGVEGSIAA
ncbi:hypothetical protein EDB85DRAFT_1893682 [Lactarius pseudohatsudake]|nr:hypothetical protein EDB85DRAFT_1893682 [Lactarius pseudohatsudake]